jgi:hypothetical protein
MKSAEDGGVKLSRAQWAIVGLVVLEFVLPRFQAARPHSPAPFNQFALFAVIMAGCVWFFRPSMPSSAQSPLPRWLAFSMLAFMFGTVAYALLTGMQTGTMPVLPRWVGMATKAMFAVGLIAAFIYAGKNPEKAAREHSAIWRGSAAIVTGMIGVALGVRALHAFTTYGPQTAQPWTTAAVSAAVMTLAVKIRGPRDAAAQ